MINGGGGDLNSRIDQKQKRGVYVVCRQDLGSPPFSPRGSSGEKERNIRADSRADLGESFIRKADSPQLVQGRNSRGGIAASSAESRSNRDPFIESDSRSAAFQ